MKEIYGHTSFVYDGEEISYIISSGIDLKDEQKYYLPSLQFVKEYGTHYEEEIACWDAESFLISVLLEEVLIPWIDNKDIPNKTEFAAILSVNGVKLDDFEGIRDLILTAKNEGMFNEYFNSLLENGNNS